MMQVYRLWKVALVSMLVAGAWAQSPFMPPAYIGEKVLLYFRHGLGQSRARRSTTESVRDGHLLRRCALHAALF
jgi:hypothetical protein